MIRCKSRSF